MSNPNGQTGGEEGESATWQRQEETGRRGRACPPQTDGAAAAEAGRGLVSRGLVRRKGVCSSSGGDRSGGREGWREPQEKQGRRRGRSCCACARGGRRWRPFPDWCWERPIAKPKCSGAHYSRRLRSPVSGLPTLLRSAVSTSPRTRFRLTG